MSFPNRYNAYSSWRTAIVEVADEFVPLGDFPCDEVVLYVESGINLRVISSSWIAGSEADTDQYVLAEAPAGLVIPVGGNANEIAVRRDSGSDPVTVRYIWRKFAR